MSISKKYLNPKNDAAFKRIFGKDKNKDILITMLNAVLKNQLHKPIKQIEFVNPQLPPEIAGSKQSTVDVLCRDKDGCKYIIEMQIGHADGFETRAQYYAAKAFIEQAREGDKYYRLKEVIFLAFCDFSIFPKKKHYKSEHVILDNKSYERDLDMFSFTFIDLVKFDKELTKSVEQLTEEEKFYYFLCHATDINDEDVALLAKTPALKKAFTALERYSWSQEEYALYEAAEKRERDYLSTLIFREKQGIKIGEKRGIKIGRSEGIKIGEKRGIKMGEERGQKQVIKKLLAHGTDKSKVAEMLGLTLEKLDKLLTSTD